ncbi:P12 domain protein [Rhizoctonia solani 123E]|uniref:p12 domain protein n=1 Tax=Rhizoctonia solani 123E TaxID=1423351 RepID=A0A074S366_9AGAM|nr:P12 domain protein [Rhizoctonia solani 123E]
MSVAFPYTPFPFNVTAISPLFDLSPVASNDTNLGWVPSCTTPECVPTASWSTSAINSTLSFQFWGWDVAFDGNVKGNMSVKVIRDGVPAAWNPSEDTLYSARGAPTDQFYLHNITLQIIDASPDAQMTIIKARVNGSSFADNYYPTDRWEVPSNDERIERIGFDLQTSEAHPESSTTYISSRAGDTLSMWFNASTFLVYGSCGPGSGLMRVSINDQQQIVNTSKPFASSDCLLFQTHGLPIFIRHLLLIENMDGRTLGINRFEFFRFIYYKERGMSERTLAVACGTAVAAIACITLVVVYVWNKAKTKLGEDGLRVNRRWFQLL